MLVKFDKQQDTEENNLHLHSIFIFSIKDFHSLNGFWDWVAAPDEHAVDVKRKDKRIGNGARLIGGDRCGDAGDTISGAD
jgi:hypothetical protein